VHHKSHIFPFSFNLSRFVENEIQYEKIQVELNFEENLKTKYNIT